ncbi:hypothetical protein [Leptobacterium sp. I13]|uniref:hypothetical protein n=1 Tax=Leptobacterium meishanense TaxID=3128904 RepID=UPI0030EE870C
MKQLKINKLSIVLWVLVTGATFSVYAQKQTKKTTESFDVNKDVTIDINTSYTDIEFETWNKNKVEITAILEIDGASEEEVEGYFESWDFEALGNKSKVSISTKGNMWFHRGGNATVIAPGTMEFDFVMPEISEIPEIAPFVIQLDSLHVMPPIPPMVFHEFDSFSFDYEAYEKEGDAYLKKWKEKFNKNFNENFKKEMEVWKKEMAQHKKEMEKIKWEVKIDRDEIKKEKEQALKEAKKAIEEQKHEIEEAKIILKETMRNKKEGNMFFFAPDGKKGNLKVKKTIKIKIPKDAKLKMNVRHGEVKLAENTTNIKATLSYTRLLANNINGEYTDIEAFYAPVAVQNWNYGQLKVNYVDKVAIENVKSLKLTANSSNVVIDNLIDNGFINGSFGELYVGNINKNFSTLDVNLENTDTVIILPETGFNFYYNGADSKVKYPKEMIVKTTDNYANKLIKGYYKNKNQDKIIKINAHYSDVALRNVTNQ